MKSANKPVTALALRELLSYEPDTGLFRWLVNRSSVKAGDDTGYLRKDGYLSIRVFGRDYQAHRLAWLYVTGEWPTGQIDHINRIRSDNRWANLRDCTATQNRQNMVVQSNNKSGFKGVSWDKEKKKWRAAIKCLGKSQNLGSYDTPQEAAAAYAAAAAEHHTHNPLAKTDAVLVHRINSRRGQFGSPGSTNPRAKLAESEVLEIRASSLDSRALSEKFCVSTNTINHIKRGVTWKTL